MIPVDFIEMSIKCAPTVDVRTMQALVDIESGFNQFAIGVVGWDLPKQPKNLKEAMGAVAYLEKMGYNYSVGYGQINKYNFKKYNLTIETAFDKCRNLNASSNHLEECFVKAKVNLPDPQEALKAALSCYNTGNMTFGLKKRKDGKKTYVEKIFERALRILSGKNGKHEDEYPKDAPEWVRYNKN